MHLGLISAYLKTAAFSTKWSDKMRFFKVASLILTTLSFSAGAASGETTAESILNDSLGSINQCYYGVGGTNPCNVNVTAIALTIGGEWTAIAKPWTIEFHPNGLLDMKTGMLSMTTVGPARNARYRLESNAAYPSIFVDFDNGNRFQVSVALFGDRLLLIDKDGTTTFVRP